MGVRFAGIPSSPGRNSSTAVIGSDLNISFFPLYMTPIIYLCVLIKHYFLLGKTIMETEEELVKYYGKSTGTKQEKKFGGGGPIEKLKNKRYFGFHKT